MYFLLQVDGPFTVGLYGVGLVSSRLREPVLAEGAQRTDCAYSPFLHSQIPFNFR